MVEILREQFGLFYMVLQDGIPWQMYALLLFAIVVATTVHEFGHAWMADKLGDPTPRSEGRVRLSPFAHIDPMGFAMLVVTMLIGFPVGWGRPVRTNPENYRCGERKGIALVAAAGPAMNLLTAILLAPITRFVLGGGIGRDETAMWIFIALAITILINLSLFCFNLVPIHPLDGSHITASLLPESLAKPYRTFMQQYGFYLLLFLMITGTLGKFIGPIVLALFRFLVGM
jgi:Zn-dependent protease